MLKTLGLFLLVLLSGLSLQAQDGKMIPSSVKSELVKVKSKDGTVIGFECGGAGPTLLFVHGGVGDRSLWTPMFPLLASRFTVCAMDRRGRGASGDSRQYSLMKEAEDVAAVVNSRKGPVFVLGHSYGGVVALESAFLTKRISRLMLYEPPFHEPVDENLAAAKRLEELIAKDDPEKALITFRTEVVKQSPEDVARMKQRPSWPSLIATVSLQPRQMRALAAYGYDPKRVRSVTVPTLLLLGEATANPYLKQSIRTLQESLPDSTLVTLKGQGHYAMETGREQLADAIIKFTTADRPSSNK